MDPNITFGPLSNTANNSVTQGFRANPEARPGPRPRAYAVAGGAGDYLLLRIGTQDRFTLLDGGQTDESAQILFLGILGSNSIDSNLHGNSPPNLAAHSGTYVQ
jgi:hypothetical protein